jgi:hypothetical protein
MQPDAEPHAGPEQRPHHGEELPLVLAVSAPTNPSCSALRAICPR